MRVFCTWLLLIVLIGTCGCAQKEKAQSQDTFAEADTSRALQKDRTTRKDSLKGFLSIPFGASPEQVKSFMRTRDGVKLRADSVFGFQDSSNITIDSTSFDELVYLGGQYAGLEAKSWKFGFDYRDFASVSLMLTSSERVLASELMPQLAEAITEKYGVEMDTLKPDIGDPVTSFEFADGSIEMDGAYFNVQLGYYADFPNERERRKQKQDSSRASERIRSSTDDL